VSSGFLFLLVVGLALTAAHVASDWVARRLLVVSGAEYLVIGVLLGPRGFHVVSADQLRQFAPVTLLALGFIGLSLGMRCHLPSLVQVPGLAWRLAFAQAFTTLGVVAALVAAILIGRDGLDVALALPPAIALGAIAAVSLPQAVEVAARALGRAGPTVELLRTATLVDGLIGVSAFGMLMALGHAPVDGFARTPTPTEWAVIATGIGVACGALFHLFVGGDGSPDRVVISLAGATLLATGTAAHLGLSPLYSTTVMGIILVNTARRREFLEGVLRRAEQPLVFVMLILAGASWHPGADVAVALPVIVYLLARWTGKVGGARIATRANGAAAEHGLDWGRALLGQGSLALAMGYAWLSNGATQLGDLVFTGAVAGVLFTDLSAARMVRNVLAPLLPPQATPLPAASVARPDAPDVAVGRDGE
jgi:hypothetical protein